MLNARSCPVYQHILGLLPMPRLEPDFQPFRAKTVLLYMRLLPRSLQLRTRLRFRHFLLHSRVPIHSYIATEHSFLCWKCSAIHNYWVPTVLGLPHEPIVHNERIHHHCLDKLAENAHDFDELQGRRTAQHRERKGTHCI